MEDDEQKFSLSLAILSILGVQTKEDKQIVPKRARWRYASVTTPQVVNEENCGYLE